MSGEFGGNFICKHAHAEKMDQKHCTNYPGGHTCPPPPLYDPNFWVLNPLPLGSDREGGSYMVSHTDTKTDFIKSQKSQRGEPASPAPPYITTEASRRVRETCVRGGHLPADATPKKTQREKKRVMITVASSAEQNSSLSKSTQN